MPIEHDKHTWDSINVMEATTQKLVGMGREEVLEKKQYSAKHAILEGTPSSTYQLSVVVAVSNEQENVQPFLESLQKACDGLCVEVILVNVSGGETLELIEDATGTMHSPLFQIRIEPNLAEGTRTGGLGTAIVHGLHEAQAEYIAVMHTGLVHQAEQLCVLYEQAVGRNVDLVIGISSTKKRSQAEQLCALYEQAVGRNVDLVIGISPTKKRSQRGVPVYLKWLTWLFFSGQLRSASNPWSDFFLLRRELLADVTLHPISHKLLLEMLIRCEWQQLLEVSYDAHDDDQGQIPESRQIWQHMLHLWLDVPIVGRVWKISLLLLVNLLLLSVLLVVDKSFPWFLSNLSMLVFVLIAGLDFVLLNRFVFPSPVVKGATSSLSIEESETSEALVKEKTGAAQVDPVQKLQPKGKTSDKFLPKVAVVLIILAVGWISYMRPGALLVLAVLFVGSAMMLGKTVRREQAITMLLAVSTGVATIDYVSWRFVVTNWQGWWIAAPLLFAETLGAIHGLGFQFTVWPWLPPKLGKREDATSHPIFIFIPTVNEGVMILRPTLEGVIAARDEYLARYPHGQVTIVLCNDGRVAKAANWEEAEALAQELGVCCVTRTVGGGAKAGNIENARQLLQATGDALLVIFDADQVARPDFLLKTIPPFCDPKMGWVQTGQYYANLDNPVSRWADDQQSMFYNLLCPGKAALNAAFICGTNVVIRATALDEIGGLPQNSVTEDFAASIVLHRSWRSVYLKDVLATGLGPLDVPSYLKQQSRWALGTLGVLRTHWHDILLPKKNGLRIGQRFHYFLACTHYLCGLRDLIYLISPILFVFTGIPAVGGTTINEYLWHFLPYALISAIGMWYASRNVTGLRGIVIGFGSFPVLIGSLLSVILRRKVGFAVTSKQRGGKRSSGYLYIYYVAFLLCAFALYWATRATGQQRLSLYVSVLWILYSMVMLGSFLWLNFKDMRFHTIVQSAKTSNETIANQPYPMKLEKRRHGLNPVLNLGLGLLLALPILAHSSLDTLLSFTDRPSTPFLLKGENAPYFGVSLPVQLLHKEPSVLQRDLGTQFSIIGRTQDVAHDRFDTSWANQLAAQQARPWITLQFGELGRGRLPPLDASLLAIINGLHDQELSRWAEDIRNYDKPVYLPILLHADKNWSLSSGVANGGIPQDVSKAWTHVQAVFHAVGANNVAWVWAPADPLHDQQYAPPLGTIDAILQDFINYPGDTWGDPKTVLHDLIKRYPTKPIIVEASVDGSSPTRKADWLTLLGLAVNAMPQVHALLYHEGGPELNASATQIHSWSLASDPASLAVIRHIVSVLHQRAKSTAKTS